MMLMLMVLVVFDWNKCMTALKEGILRRGTHVIVMTMVEVRHALYAR